MNDGSWFCDRCGNLIQEPEHGWVEWLVNGEGEGVGYGLRLVHQALHSPLGRGKCQYHEEAEFNISKAIVCDGLLERFLGPDGLMYLLSWLERDSLPKAAVLEMIRRLHIKGYEEVRSYIGRAVADGVIDRPYPAGYLSQEEIASVLSWLRAERKEEEV